MRRPFVASVLTRPSSLPANHFAKKPPVLGLNLPGSREVKPVPYPKVGTPDGRLAHRAFLAPWVVLWLAVVVGLLAKAQAQTPPDPSPSPILLVDSFGRTQEVSTNDVHSSLHPPESTGIYQQIPTAARGASQAPSVRDRIRASKSEREWFPVTPPGLMPYLANLDEYGNTAIQPGPLIASEPLSKAVQSAKYALSEIGLRYTFYQSFTMVSMTGVAEGSSALQYYTSTFLGKWAISELTNSSRATWISTEVNTQVGLSPASRAQSPQGNLGSLVNPQGTVFGPNGIWVSELAYQQSFCNGQFVLLAGQVDQSNYLDANTYANNSQGQFLNSAFVNSMILPFAFNNLGLNLQYQPNEHWYVMFGSGANNQNPGQSPFQQLTFNNWSYLLEFGLTPTNVCGLGPGTYRFQPFLATIDGTTQVGLGLNLQQQLGATSPFAWFGRFGVTGSQIAAEGASAQIATGLACQGPLVHLGLAPKRSNDYLGLGFVWSRASANSEPTTTPTREYGLETMYVLQLTPLASIQPDFQVIWDPINNPTSDHCLVFQLQLNLTW